MVEKKMAILHTAASLFHQKGFHNVGLKEILDAVNIPKGSFYHYFSSKEKLVLDIMDIYIEDTLSLTESVDQSIDGLRDFFNIFFDRVIGMNLKQGCPVGNLILEISDEKEEYREKLQIWYKIIEDWAVDILMTANVPDAYDKACMMISNYEGVIMMARLNKNAVYFKQFENIFFNSLLKKAV